jgi:hypothetical protein
VPASVRCLRHYLSREETKDTDTKEGSTAMQALPAISKHPLYELLKKA